MRDRDFFESQIDIRSRLDEKQKRRAFEKLAAGIGAAGITNDWDIDAEIVDKVNCPVILAGGLGPDNVRDAILKVRPWGVDSFTKTSDKFQDGSSRKNIEKVKAFIDEAVRAFEHIQQ